MEVTKHFANSNVYLPATSDGVVEPGQSVLINAGPHDACTHKEFPFS